MSTGDSGKKLYAPILPAPGSSTSSTASGNIKPSDLPPKRQKRAGTGRSACDACRARKSACDSRRPACSTCTKRQTQCVYSPRLTSGIKLEEQVELDFLRQQNDDSRKQHGSSVAAGILESVRTLPEDQALLLFHRLRASASKSHPGYLTTDDIHPASTLSVEYELMIRHPALYPVVSPETKITLPITSAAQLSGLEQHAPQEDLSSLPSIDPSNSPVPSSEQRSPSPTTSDLCDQRLAFFNVHNWLQVPVRSEFAAHAISFYLTTEHPILGLFDANLFLNDLVARKTDFCSPLLLSAVLSVACQGYRAIDPEAARFGHDFFAEAERLYTEEKTGEPQYESATMTIAAARLLCRAAFCHGWVRTAARYLYDGNQMAHANGLLSVPRKDGAMLWLDGNIDNVRAAAHAAWGTFCTTVFHGSWNANVNIQPWLPTPGTIINRDDGSTISFPLPGYMGQSFTQSCRLAPLINNTLHQHTLATKGRISFDLAEKAYTRLLEWVDSLPISMGPGRDMPHHVAIVHIQFHTAVLDLFRPSMQQNPKLSMKLDCFSAENRTVEDVCHASINQLKHLVLVFRTRYSCASSCLLWHKALLYVANDCVSDQAASGRQKGTEDDAEMNSTNRDAAKVERTRWFMACVDGYKALAPQFPIAGGVMRGLLSMGIEKGLITAAEGRAYMAGVEVDATLMASRTHISQEHSEEPWMSASNFNTGLDPLQNQDHFIVDLNGAMANPSAASIEALAQRFDEVVMLDELSASVKTGNPTFT